MLLHPAFQLREGLGNHPSHRHNLYFVASQTRSRCSDWRTWLSLAHASAYDAPLPRQLLRQRMRDYTFKEKTRITAGAVAALVIVLWLAVVALGILSSG